MNDMLEDKELIDPPEPKSFECHFCKEDVSMKYHGIALVNQKEVDCCEWCEEDLNFCKNGKCIISKSRSYVCECEEES